MTLKLPGKNVGITGGVNFAKGLDGKSLEVALYGNTHIGWDKAFGIPFLSLNEIGLISPT